MIQSFPKAYVIIYFLISVPIQTFIPNKVRNPGSGIFLLSSPFIVNIQIVHKISNIQGSHRIEKYLNLEGFLEKSLKNKSALKSTGKSLKGLEKSLNFTIYRRIQQCYWIPKSVSNCGAFIWYSISFLI